MLLLFLPMLDQFLHHVHADAHFVLQRLNDAAGLAQQLRLDQPLVSVSGIPLPAHRHRHQSIELPRRLVLRRQLSHHVLLNELSVTVLSVHLNTLHLAIETLLLQLLNLCLSQIFCLLALGLIPTLINTGTSPLTLSLFNVGFRDLITKLFRNFLAFLLFKLL